MKQIGLFYNENVAVPELPVEKPTNINEYLNFIALEDASIGFTRYDRDLQYSFNKTTWTDYTEENRNIDVLTGQRVFFRRNNTSVISGQQFGTFWGSKTWNVAGNLLSILDGYNYKTFTTLYGWGGGGNGIFENMLDYRIPIVDARGLYIGNIDATNQTNPYRNLFIRNTALVYGPKITIFAMESVTFYWAFGGCTNLQMIPDIQTQSFIFNAAFLKQCPSLNYIKISADTITGSVPGSEWSATGTIVLKSGASWNVTGLPSGWTIVYE